MKSANSAIMISPAMIMRPKSPALLSFNFFKRLTHRLAGGIIWFWFVVFSIIDCKN